MDYITVPFLWAIFVALVPGVPEAGFYSAPFHDILCARQASIADRAPGLHQAAS
jgi:hypothetical protein